MFEVDGEAAHGYGSPTRGREKSPTSRRYGPSEPLYDEFVGYRTSPTSHEPAGRIEKQATSASLESAANVKYYRAYANARKLVKEQPAPMELKREVAKERADAAKEARTALTRCQLCWYQCSFTLTKCWMSM